MFHVISKCAKPGRILADHSERHVAARADQSADALAADALAGLPGAARVVVVDDEAGPGEGATRAHIWRLPARRATAVLLDEQVPDVAQPDAVEGPQLVVEVGVGCAEPVCLAALVGASRTVPPSLRPVRAVPLAHFVAALRTRLHVAIMPNSDALTSEACRG